LAVVMLEEGIAFAAAGAVEEGGGAGVEGERERALFPGGFVIF